MPRQKQPDYSWINQPPAEDEILTNLDGKSQFIPIGIVEKKLYRLDSHWSTENFKFRLWVGRSGRMWTEASLELVVTYGRKTRRLVGAATIMVSPDVDFDDPEVNLNFSATLKAECIKNAVKPIGISFGQGLNDRLTSFNPEQAAQPKAKKKPAAVDMIPDETMQSKYNRAVENSDQKIMAVIRTAYPSIQYTGYQKINHAEN